VAIPDDAAPVVDGFGPCSPWATDVDMCADGIDERPEDVAAALAIATQIVWALSGRQFGLCTILDWRPPCLPGGDCWHLYLSQMNRITSYDLRSSGWRTRTTPYELDMRPRVERILEVTIDGVVLDEAAYRLDSHRYLVRTDGSWPSCQDFSADLGDPNTWGISAERGRPVPAAGADAVAALASEVFKGRCGSKQCRLPRRVVAVNRKDVSIELADPTSFLDEGRTGIVEVDLFISAVNPARLRRRGRVMSPEQLRRRSRV